MRSGRPCSLKLSGQSGDLGLEFVGTVVRADRSGVDQGWRGPMENDPSQAPMQLGESAGANEASPRQ
jgi:hypothetical protein